MKREDMNITTEMALKALLHNQDIYIKRLEDELEEVKAISTKHVKALNRKRDYYNKIEQEFSHYKGWERECKYYQNLFNNLKEFDSKMVQRLVVMYLKVKLKIEPVVVTINYNTTTIDVMYRCTKDKYGRFTTISFKQIYEMMEELQNVN